MANRMVVIPEEVYENLANRGNSLFQDPRDCQLIEASQKATKSLHSYSRPADQRNALYDQDIKAVIRLLNERIDQIPGAKNAVVQQLMRGILPPFDVKDDTPKASAYPLRDEFPKEEEEERPRRVARYDDDVDVKPRRVGARNERDPSVERARPRTLKPARTHEDPQDDPMQDEEDPLAHAVPRSKPVKKEKELKRLRHGARPIKEEANGASRRKTPVRVKEEPLDDYDAEVPDEYMANPVKNEEARRVPPQTTSSVIRRQREIHKKGRAKTPFSLPKSRLFLEKEGTPKRLQHGQGASLGPHKARRTAVPPPPPLRPQLWTM